MSNATRRTPIMLAAAMLLSIVVARAMQPQANSEVLPGLQVAIPSIIGNWVEQTQSLPQIGVTAQNKNDPAQGDGSTYDEVVMRTYRRSDGASVMLALAYAKTQQQELKIHRPELCYAANGYAVRDEGSRSIALDERTVVSARTLWTQSMQRREPVTYWIRIGNEISQSAWQTRWIIFKSGLARRIPDGVLVRVSSVIESDAERAQALQLQSQFLADLYHVLSSAERARLAGNRP